MPELKLLGNGHLKLDYLEWKDSFDRDLDEWVRSQVKRLIEQALEVERDYQMHLGYYQHAPEFPISRFDTPPIGRPGKGRVPIPFRRPGKGRVPILFRRPSKGRVPILFRRPSKGRVPVLMRKKPPHFFDFIRGSQAHAFAVLSPHERRAPAAPRTPPWPRWPLFTSFSKILDGVVPCRISSFEFRVSKNIHGPRQTNPSAEWISI